MKKEKDIKNLRENIDSIDSQILELLNKRMEDVKNIGNLKQDDNSVFYVPSRENEIYKRLVAENKGVLSKPALKAIFREIMSAALSIEKKIKIAYLGPEGTFTNQASLNKFGKSVNYLPIGNITDVFEEVSKGRCDYGVIPIENTTEGAVTHTLDMFVDFDVKICSEITLQIHHNLMVKNKDAKIKKIYSNPQAFAQSRRWLQMNYPNVELIPVESTTMAAKLAKEQKDAGAIASKLAAEIYELVILNKEIEDSAHNMTRFLILGTEYSKQSGKDKTSLMFSIKDKVGVLYEALLPFRKNKINLTKIESRPSKKKAWEYLFFVDLEGHFEDKNVKKAIAELDKHCIFCKILGSYPSEV